MGQKYGVDTGNQTCSVLSIRLATDNNLREKVRDCYMNRTTNLWAKKTYEPQNEQMRIEWKRWRKGQSCSYGAVMRWAGVMWSGLPLAGPLACYSSYSDDFSAAGELWWPWHMFTVLTTVREQEETLEKCPDREHFYPAASF